ncbi:MAG: hypothetical protein F6K61_18595 [Sphaerospermopsis sp. SIO1G1]|nr:hypothetical protein [Sphaerospermopsis sp. SIO1G1]
MQIESFIFGEIGTGNRKWEKRNEKECQVGEWMLAKINHFELLAIAKL